jgi:formylglycine-generating enzyme
MRKVFLFFLLISFAISGCSNQFAEAATPLPIIYTGIDPESWAVVPEGYYLRGQHEHPTLVDYDFEMMVTHVTNSQYAQYLNQALEIGFVKIIEDQVAGYYPGDRYDGYKHEEEIPFGDYIHLPLNEPGLRLTFRNQVFTSLPGYEDHPMVQVSWFGAKAYCEYNGWRLPSESEWEKAARGEDNRPFPWGFEIARNNANHYRSHDIYEGSYNELGDTTPVGFYNGMKHMGYQTINSPSPYGLYDMAGNVWQWTGDIYEQSHYRYMRGGSKENYQHDLRIWTRNSAGPTYYSPNVGFRCVRDVR